jgi:Flp pilus assembly protein TadD
MRALEQYRDAAVAFDYAVHIDPKFAQGWVDRGDALKALGRMEEAEEAYEEARELGLRC